MRNFIKVLFFIWASLFLIPYAIIVLSGYKTQSFAEQSIRRKEAINGTSIEEQGGTVIEDKEIVAVLAKSIPYTYEMDTLKAQAIITRTYLARRKLGIESKGTLAQYTEQEMKDLWGENFNKIYDIYMEAARETEGLGIYYNEELIEPVYHSASAGCTRDSLDVYGIDIPYLKSVKSEQDTLMKQMEMGRDQVMNLLKEKYPDILIEAQEIENQIQIIERDQADYIKQIQVGNKIISGEELRELLGLSSSNFKVVTGEDKLIFVTKGIGHGVGFSQNGANEMVKAGKDCNDILKYYFKDIKIKKING